MIDLKYKITKFDSENKVVVVTFEDGGWAELRLTNPLPKNVDELETIIRQFAAPVEAIEARTNPDTDISYIYDLVDVERTTTRHTLTPTPTATETATPPVIDPAVEANLKMWEDLNFQQKVGDALVKLGVLQTNPTTIPVTSL